LPNALEFGGAPSDRETPLVQQLISAIRVVAGLDDPQQPQPPADEHVNGWDETLAVNGAGKEESSAAH
jgi:hypothetical protein